MDISIISHISNFSKFDGGIESFTIRFSKKLVHEGFKVRVFGIRGFVDYIEGKILIKDEHFEISKNLEFFNIFHSGNYIRKYERNLRGSDLLLLFASDKGFVARTANKILGKLHVPLIIMPHFTLEQIRAYSAFQSSDRATIIFRKNAQQTIGKSLSNLKKHLQISDSIVLPSYYCLNQFRETYPEYREKMVIIPPGIDIGFFNRDQSIKRKNLVLMVSRLKLPWSIHKNFFSLMEAAALIRKKMEDTSILILGPGDAHARLRELCRKMRINKFCHIGNYRSPAQLRVLYNQARVFTSPSSIEAAPTTIIEALSCETPVVALKSCATPEIVGREEFLLRGSLKMRENIEFFEPDIIEYSDRITDILQNLTESINMARRESQRVRNEYSLERTFKDFSELFYKLA